METINVTVLATLIMGFTQLITTMYPKVNKMNVTIIVTVVLGILALSIRDSVTIMTVILALITEVFGYNLVTKSVLPTIRNIRKTF